ncbi:hypothetical protein LIER_02318 [Lithospermum erythrorhizon]|uniref:Midasin n=1 Tax=Lithospermum erythrorhizon TaxID=34254 RepID=A0AAV3NPE9_LITER
MDEQMDGKMLLGSYVCTEKPGEFKWQPGSLTQAVHDGFWVVFEDIDKAPPDIQPILLPLLEGATTFMTGYGEAIRVNEGFRLFSTVVSSKLDLPHAIEGDTSAFGALWRRVAVRNSCTEDLLMVVHAWFPKLDPIAEKLIETFEKVNETSGTMASSSGNRFSLRDLLKWCKRINDLGTCFDGDVLPSYLLDRIYSEAIDVFASFTTRVEKRLVLMKEIARLLNVMAPETLYSVDKPTIEEHQMDIRIGRVTLPLAGPRAHLTEKKPFVEIHRSVHVLEKIACSVKYNEPVLLVGETGTGKTTLVQNLATRLGHKLTVVNLSQQSEAADLLGGFKPLNAQCVTYSVYLQDNEEFIHHLNKSVLEKNWKQLMDHCQKVLQKLEDIKKKGSGKKRKRSLSDDIWKAWEKFSSKLSSVRAQVSSSGMIFSFIEGAFVTALKNGEWILLDEVNLAPAETLQRIIGVIEDENGSLCLTERGDVDYINRHSNFRIFACMNPATDSGKRDLPYALRGKFTEYYVDDVLNDKDLMMFIHQFMGDNCSNLELVSKVMHFYKAARKQAEERLQDGANMKPQYSLRSLYRALEYMRMARKQFGFDKALYDGFYMFFSSLLNVPSAAVMKQLISSHLLGGKIPQSVPFHKYLTSVNCRDDGFLRSYVLTKSVEEHLSNLARAITVHRYPVLLQGPTSSGKTSLVQYLAAITGHEFVRINNHEHTDLQEYLGSYITDASGKLSFQEGALVRAVRDGSWIVLDELNLAPSDVLEALNRLLDDNRELFIPELNETIRAHPKFMLFATQNPPMMYGGRKILSRAFRNRFVEIHVEEIPDDELSTILEKRCQIPPSYAKKMIDVMKELQLHRQSSKIFAGKHGFITPRDLFRWANRFRIYGKCYDDLARDGYYLLAERLRNENEKKVVQQVLEKHLRVKLDTADIYKQNINFTAMNEGGDGIAKPSAGPLGFDKIIWTQSMRRLYFLVERCFELREPVLLVGETGGGKTTVCQMLSYYLSSELHILNCHQYTETSDFLGGFYPVRDRSSISSDFEQICKKLSSLKAVIHYSDDMIISSDINQASQTIAKLSAVISSYKQGLSSHPDVTEEKIHCIEHLVQNLDQLHKNWQTIFTWQDGPLLEAMKSGSMFLVDEISLADDSVLERLNSVLEPERKLSLAEKGGSYLECITAHPNFFLLATMNPGGDYGKKELSPALRNRFTEIWVPSVCEVDELKSIAVERLSSPHLRRIADVLLNFWEWFNQLGTGRILTVRDLLAWVSFINIAGPNLGPESSCIHGAFLVLLDGISLGTSVSKNEAADLRSKCSSFLVDKLKESQPSSNCTDISSLDVFGSAESRISDVSHNMQCENLFGIHPFYIEKGDRPLDDKGFKFDAPTTRRNALRVLRAMQLVKPVLLEGSPGVGKTSLIVALGKYSGHDVVRINLSEQTDMMDLLGSDLPVESDDGVQFAWSDGILLQAIKDGSWVLLDELNLAPQSVLEGLNAILDHRAEVFIPELGRRFKCPPSFRVFACQNPSSQGGGRKGLPKSFLNRFTKVYVDELVEDDYLSICRSLYPSIPESICQKLVEFNKLLYKDTMELHKFAHVGSPWEFNLRDILRSCQIIQGAPENLKLDCFLNTVYVQRMRTKADRQAVRNLYHSVFGSHAQRNLHPRVHVNPKYLVVGNVSLERNSSKATKKSVSELKLLPGQSHSLEAVAHVVKQQWLCILVGPASSGKTSIVRILSQLTGNVLNELNLSSTTEISELLGCFEQYNALRNYRIMVSRIERYINEYCSLKLKMSTEEFVKTEDLMSLWLLFLKNIGYNSPTNNTTSSIETSWMHYFEFIYDFIKVIERLRFDVDKSLLSWSREDHSDEDSDVDKSLRVSWSREDLSDVLKEIKKWDEDYKGRRYSIKFEWVAGLLIKAIENGEWIVFENANLCNPTVLDRINSLVEQSGEQSGSITINECGLVNGKPLILRPHSHFRMFLTVNPAYGEVSRAMRNRGVEIFMMHPYCQLDEKFSEHPFETELEEVKRFVIISGIPIGRLVNKMAEAHIYAKHEGAKIHVSITNLELSRWIQLFQRLVTNGNQALWSLQISWEHTYLSSLGEGSGKTIVARATLSYLTLSELSRFDSCQDSLLCTPGGWPSHLTLGDFVCYSRESSVRQNCIYVEFLGVLLASCSSSATVTALVPLFDMKRIYTLIFPKESMPKSFNDPIEFNSTLVRQMLMFSANWTVEQAVESDFEIYLLWFEKFKSQIRQSFFSHFIDVMKKIRQHPIWNQILQCRRELIEDGAIDEEQTPVPVLSTALVYLSLSGTGLNTGSLLKKSITAEGLLRRSLYQRALEGEFHYSEKTKVFQPILESLQTVEEKVLDLLVESPLFDDLFQLYSELFDHHLMLWNGVISSWSECLVVSIRALRKTFTKLEKHFPEVDNFLMKIQNFLRSSWSFRYDKSLLWAYGGHPPSPPNEDVYMKYSQVQNFWEKSWPRKTNLEEVGHIEGVLSINPVLRSLSLEGISLSSYMVGKDRENDLSVQKLEGMYQDLMQRLHFERSKLAEIVRATDQTNFEADMPACCSFSPDMFCKKAVYNTWIEAVPLIDSTSFFLDTEVVEKLSQVALLDVKDQYAALSDLSSLLKSALRMSSNFSSRPPTDFCPHQKILWTVGAGAEMEPKEGEISSFSLEMWLKWHKFLWTSTGNMVYSNDSDNQLPVWLFKPLKMLTVDRISQGTTAIRDYFEHRFKLKVTSSTLWEDNTKITNEYEFLLSAAQNVFKSIIHAHRKSFSDEIYAQIKSCFYSSFESIMTKENLSVLIFLLASSKHHTFSSLLDNFIKPVLHILYEECVISKSFGTVGCAWLLIGCMHYHLLICSDDLDPTVKYSIKYKHLMERIASLELENEVRETCVRLSGCFQLTEIDRKKKCQELQAEAKKLYRKVVFRSHPDKFKELKYECDEFREEKVSKILECIRVEETSSEVIRNLQETITSFIEGLSRKYPSYSDIVEPVQVALYEIKLGLSLIRSTSCEKTLKTSRYLNIESTLASVQSFMRFPGGPPAKAVSVDASSWQSKLSSSVVKMPTYIGREDWTLLEKLLLPSSNNVHAEETVSALQLKTDFLKNLLLKAMHNILIAHFMDNESFELFDEVFAEFGKSWMPMKLQLKDKENSDSQQFKFKPRAFRIEDIIEVDLSSLKNSIANEILLEWQESLQDEVSDEVTNKESVETPDDWHFLEGSLLRDMVDIYNKMFGTMSSSISQLQPSDGERESSFVGSYRLGVRMIEGLEGILTSGFDVRLLPEHLFLICLEHEHKFNLPYKSSQEYNFYKDPNAHSMAKLVGLLVNLKRKIMFLLKEWDSSDALQRVIDVIDMVLAIPMSTPLAKALSAVEFLLNRVTMLQETVAKFPLSDELEPIYILLSSWYKLEFGCWPALVDEVHTQFDVNAGKLWFPLYSVLRRTNSADTGAYIQATIQSLEDFIRMSCIGEFKKRLQLLLAFHRHIHCGQSRGCKNPFPYPAETKKVLYNTFGFYMQFMPIITNQIETNRRSIEQELKNFEKLCRWEHIDNYLAVERFKKTRKKLKKIIHKYSDQLNQPIMISLSQEAARRGINAQPLPGSNLLEVSCQHSLIDVGDQIEVLRSNRSPWLTDWEKKVDSVLQNLRLCNQSDIACFGTSFKDVKGLLCTIDGNIPPGFIGLPERRDQMWLTVGKLCNFVTTDCCELWTDEKRSLGKRRVFSDLLKLLSSYGLTRHRKSNVENESGVNQNSWVLQPSYDLQHLLMAPDANSSDDMGSCGLETEWRFANQYYFKGIASVHDLQQICSNFHKDFTLEQVQRPVSYLNHLMEIQQEQRVAAYGFSNQLKCLRECMWPLVNLFSSSNSIISLNCGECCYTQKQRAFLQCMWQQKQLLDSLFMMIHDECLLLQRVEDHHLDTCASVKDAAKLRIFIEKFVQDFKISKDSLDSHLLGCDRVVLVDKRATLHPSGVTEDMIQLVNHNFHLLKIFEESVRAFYMQEMSGGSVKRILLLHYDAIFEKVKSVAKELNAALQTSYSSEIILVQSNHIGESTTVLEAEFGEAVKRIYTHIADAFCWVTSRENVSGSSNESLGNITLWKDQFESDVAKLKLSSITDELEKIILDVGKLFDSPSIGISIQGHLKQLYLFLDMILALSDGLLHDFLIMHRMMSRITLVLADKLASLFAKGFGVVDDDQAGGGSQEQSKDACGIGLGDGTGLNDVSDQIEDEDQLVGSSVKQNENQDALTNTPSENVKGVEMGQDFEADTFSVSEDSEDDDSVIDGDQQLESDMGEVGANGETVDEKQCDNEDDENLKSTNEKHENTPSMKDSGISDMELRAKEDIDGTDDAQERNPQIEKEEVGGEGPDDMNDDNINKDEALTDSTKSEPDKQTQNSHEENGKGEPQSIEESMEGGDDGDTEPMECDGPEDVDSVEEDALEMQDGSAENEKHEEMSNSMDETSDAVETDKLEENGDRANQESDQGNNRKDIKEQKKDQQFGPSSLPEDNVQNVNQCGTQPKDDCEAASLQDLSAELMNGEGGEDHLAPLSGVPDTSKNENLRADNSQGKRTSKQSGTPLLQEESFPVNMQPNPCRSIGDALDGWKEKVKVSFDLEKSNMQESDDMMDEQADEYGYTAEFEKGTAQALGPATIEQTENNVKGSDLDKESGVAEREDHVTEMELDKEPSQTCSIRSTLNFHNDIERLDQITKQENEPEGFPTNHEPILSDSSAVPESFVSMKSYHSDEQMQMDQLSITDNEMGKANVFDVSGGMGDAAASLWRRYELTTSRLSQELAEQLRLVMEPTLANKLQGDYKTGKRINMKKVIPYIASHYRKDKIWLRRTRPNKRDYQVLIAVDDSRSMLENGCGSVATEALVTVCRAMSHLEVGNLAVASFGKKGNIRLLHDFDQPFTGEAGIKMISSLTFQQENTIVDEPVVDLLKYVNNKLDDAVINARLPSGDNPLQQFVLIIADGRFHEKENLRRYVRDTLSKKRMVAFLLLDSPSPKESIIDLKEAMFPRGGGVKWMKYLDSFPFPYYVVLRDIESLPRTLSDLLRQWFELMQHEKY